MTAPALDVIYAALIEHSGEFPDGIDRCGECGLRIDSPHGRYCRAPSAFAALADLDALVQAAQADVDDYLEWRSIPGNEHKATPVMDALVVALSRVTGEARK